MDDAEDVIDWLDPHIPFVLDELDPLPDLPDEPDASTSGSKVPTAASTSSTPSASSAVSAPTSTLASTLSPGDIAKALGLTAENITMCADANVRVDLSRYMRDPATGKAAGNAHYAPGRYPFVCQRLRHPRATVLLFSSGKITCVGVNREEDACAALIKFGEMLRRRGWAGASVTTFAVRNIVLKANAGFPISLARLARDHEKHCTWEPELFPALFYKMDEPRAHFSVFSNGKLVIKGVTTVASAERALKAFYSILLKYQILDLMCV